MGFPSDLLPPLPLKIAKYHTCTILVVVIRMLENNYSLDRLALIKIVHMACSCVIEWLIMITSKIS